MQRRDFVSKAIVGVGVAGGARGFEALYAKAEQEIEALKSSAQDVKASLEERVVGLAREIKKAKHTTSAKLTGLQLQVTKLQARQALMWTWLIALSIATGVDWLTPWLGVMAA